MNAPADASGVRPCVLGLGYVGLPLALALAQRYATLGYDIDRGRVERLAAGRDDTGDVDAPELAAAAPALRFSADTDDLRACNVYIVAVPTPVTKQKHPDLEPLRAVSRTIATVLKAGDLVIYESTVYPGATEEVCVPILSEGSGLACNRDFHVGYSPERINPGDRQRRVTSIVKVTSGSDEAAAERVDALYRSVIPAGTHRAPSIRVAEAAKAIENTQRDVNIALMNEFAQIFARLGLDTDAVLQAAGSKWNFLPFRPGLVGGHCIGVDPYYLIHKAEEAGVHPELIRAARRINDRMSDYVVGRLLALLARNRIGIAGARVLVLGVTFKEDCADLRNTRVVEIVQQLHAMNAEVAVHDPCAHADDVRREHGLELLATPAPGGYDLVVLAVAHAQFRTLDEAALALWLRPGGVVFDVKHVLPRASGIERL